jgi:SAM-dependent methyltransferase
VSDVLSKLTYLTDPLPPLNAESSRKHYFGHKAFAYDIREGDNAGPGRGSDKWDRENRAVFSAFTTDGLSGPVLDIPCGTGRFLKMYETLEINAICMDVSNDMMCQARVKDPKADIREGDIMKIPLSDNTVNTSVCVRLLNFLETHEMVHALSELARVSKEAIVCSLFTGDKVERHKRRWTHKFLDFQGALTSSGFRIVKQYGIRPPELNIWVCKRGVE